MNLHRYLLGADVKEISINETVLIEKYCHDCNIVDGTATLGCVCSPPLGHVMNTTLNLGLRSPATPKFTARTDHFIEEHIGAYNGHLLSDIFSPPKPRDTPSTYPLPAQFLYGFGGNATCSESPTNRSKDWCSDYSQSCTNSNRTDRRDEGWTYNGPITCYIPQVWFPDAFHFYAIKLMGEGAWELLGYPDESCKQSPVVHITSEDMGVCKTTIPMVKAISVKPMFNGDPF